MGNAKISKPAIYSRLFLLVSFSVTNALSAVTDITLPFDRGSVIISNPRLWGGNKSYATGQQLFLSFGLLNSTGTDWRGLDIEFKIGGFCNSEPHEWSYVFHVGYILSGAQATTRQFQEAIGLVPGKNLDCNSEIVKARLLFATACADPICLGNDGPRVEGPSKEPLDIETEFGVIQGRRALEAMEEKRRDAQAAAAKAEDQRKAAEERRRAAEEQAKREADEARAVAKMISVAHRMNLHALTTELKAKGGSKEKSEFETTEHFADSQAALLLTFA